MRRRAKAINDGLTAGSNTQRWIISYADFMTLLFAFFVVLYAGSVVHEEKFDELKKTFSISLSSSVQLPDSVQILLSNTLEFPKPFFSPRNDDQQHSQIEKIDLDLEYFDYDLLQILKQGYELEPKLSIINISSEDEYIQLELPSRALFFNKSDRLTGEGEELMNLLAKQFTQFPHSINIEVFTADDTQQDDQNPWSLAAQQGAVLLQWLQLEGINSMRLSTTNYGPFRPVATNDDEDGLNINRRINFLIELDGEKEQRLKRIHRQHLLTP